MKAFLTITAIILCSGVAGAQPIDPSPDSIGIYFDEGATGYCTDMEPGGQVTAYLCLTRSSDLSGFVAWEALIELSDGGVFADFQIRGDGVNSATAPEFVVTYGTPLPRQLSTVLLEITLDVHWEWAVAMRVWPVSNPSVPLSLPAYATVDSPEEFQSLGYSWGWDEGTQIPNWCASVNDGGCLDGPSVPVGENTWSGVKSLYR
jgi:hypothetical protein